MDFTIMAPGKELYLSQRALVDVPLLMATNCPTKYQKYKDIRVIPNLTEQRLLQPAFHTHS